MPVDFFPNIPIDRLEQLILKENGEPLRGEIDTYRKLQEDLALSAFNWIVWHNLSLPIHSSNYNPYRKTSSQIDFLAICEKGIIVIEVKGGMISYKNHKFYYGRNFEKLMNQNPFSQAEGYKYTLKDRILNDFSKKYFASVVVFPHVDYTFSANIFKPNSLFTKCNADQYEYSIEKFLISAIESGKSMHSEFRTFDNLSVKDLDKIKRILNPIIFNPITQKESTTSWLRIKNLDILEGLEKNPRIFIEGAPGTGKTTTALAYIDQQISKRGLYICWNKFLLIHTKNKYHQRNNDSEVEFYTYFDFILKLNPSLSSLDLFSMESSEFDSAVKMTLTELGESIQPYDYVVADEAQDLFDRGLERFINAFTGRNNNGLKNGSSLVLYDIDQSYHLRKSEIAQIADLMRTDFAHFKLLNNRRSEQNIEIQELLSILLNDIELIYSEDFHSKFTSIKFELLDNVLLFKRFLVNGILSEIRNNKSPVKGRNTILLIESTIWNKYGNTLQELLQIRDIEELTKDNISNTFNILKHSTPLKYKGLEQENVVLFISDLKSVNSHEVFVGASRAISNLQICILNESY